MSCPKCGGFVIYTSATPVAYKPEGDDGIWGYFEAECADCDWIGYGKIWYESQCDDGMYKDNVELPKEE